MATNDQVRLADYGDYIEAAMASWDCPGAAVAIVREDEVVRVLRS